MALATVYLLLAIRESRWCWPAGLASTAIYLTLFFTERLYMESLLQVFYIGLSVYGWLHWARPARSLPVVRWASSRHVTAIGAIALLTLASGALLTTWTSAALPWLDALVSWGSVVATWMTARKVIENWIYWFVIDAISIGIYIDRGLWLTAGLCGIYLVLVVVGYRAWRRHLHPASETALAPTA